MACGKIDEEKIAYGLKHRLQLIRLTSRPLSQGSVWDMAFDHLKFKKLQNFLIILGSAIGVFSVILFLGLGNGIKGYINDQVNSLANLITQLC